MILFFYDRKICISHLTKGCSLRHPFTNALCCLLVCLFFVVVLWTDTEMSIFPPGLIKFVRSIIHSFIHVLLSSQVRLQTQPKPKPGESLLYAGTLDCFKKTLAKEVSMQTYFHLPFKAQYKFFFFYLIFVIKLLSKCFYITKKNPKFWNINKIFQFVCIVIDTLGFWSSI